MTVNEVFVYSKYAIGEATVSSNRVENRQGNITAVN